MSDIAAQDNRDTAIRLGVAVMAKMPDLPTDPKQSQDWHTLFEGALAGVMETVAVNAPQELERAWDFQRQMAAFFDPDADSGRRPLYAEIIDVVAGRSRDTIVASTGFGTEKPNVEQATNAYLEAGGQSAPWTDYQDQGPLKVVWGLELFRTPWLREADGRGRAVSDMARRNIGRPVVIFKILEPWKDKDGAAKQLRVAWHIKPLPYAEQEAGSDYIRALNESAEYQPDDDNPEASGKKASPAPKRARAPKADKADAAKQTAAKQTAAKQTATASSEDAALRDLLADKPADASPDPHFESLQDMIPAAMEAFDLPQQDVVDIYKSLGFALDDAKNPDVLGMVWAELPAAAKKLAANRG